MVEVLGIPLYDGSLTRLVDDVLETCTGELRGRDSRLISAADAHVLVRTQRDQTFARTIRDFDLRLPDGLPSVWIGRHVKGACEMEQIRGSDFFRELITRSAGTGITHYLCGGKPGVGDKLRDVCRERFGNQAVVGTFSPPFAPMTDETWAALVGDIERTRPDVVWVGLGSPKQERFARELADRVKVHYIATVGAAFDFHTGTVTAAPRWMQRVGLEWLFRLAMEPKRLWPRYSRVVPLFVLYNLRELLSKPVR